MHTISVTLFLNRFLYYPVVLVFVLNLIQRRHLKEGNAKRFATLYIGIALLAVWGFTFLSIRFAMGDPYLIPLGLAMIGIAVYFRRRFFPFRLFCSNCGKRLGAREVLFVDSNLCSECGSSNSAS